MYPSSSLVTYTLSLRFCNSYSIYSTMLPLLTIAFTKKVPHISTITHNYTTLFILFSCGSDVSTLNASKCHRGCDGIVVNPCHIGYTLPFPCCRGRGFKSCTSNSVGLLPAPNSGAFRCLLLPNFNFYLENSIFNLRTFIHLL